MPHLKATLEATTEKGKDATQSTTLDETKGYHTLIDSTSEFERERYEENRYREEQVNLMSQGSLMAPRAA